MKIQRFFNGWAFINPQFGRTIIRCHSSATNVIKWTNSKSDFHYNIIDLDENDKKFLYTIEDNNEVTITSYIGDEERVEIPGQIEGYPVTKIGGIFGTYKNLSIPATVEEISSIYSSNLENINVDNQSQYFTSKDGVLFSKNEAHLIYYPMGRKDTSYYIPEGTTAIENGFEGSMYLESIYIPKTVSQIMTDSLKIENLKEISLDEENQNYKLKDNVLYRINNNESEIVAVPSKLEGNIELLYGVTRINTYTFRNIKNLESVIIPTTVKIISHNAFKNCDNLKKIVIAANDIELTEINGGNLSFGASPNLKVYCEEGTSTQEYVKEWGIDYEIIKPIKIEIKQNPIKTSYIKNQDELDLTGGLVTITYDDGTSLDLDMTSNLLNVTGFDNSRIGNNQIGIDYKGCEVNFSVKITEKKLSAIAVTTVPTTISYVEGQNFDKTGMRVTAIYDDGTTKEVTNYTVIDGNNLSVGKTSVTISYTENGITKTTTQEINVTEKLQIDINEYTEKKEGNITYIENIFPNTTIDEMTSMIDTNGQIEIFKGTEKITNKNLKIATGMKIKVTLNSECLEYTTVVKGDLTGDGEAGDADLLRMARYKAGLDNNLTGAYLKAADINNNSEKADDIDLLKLVRILVGLDWF